MTANNPKASIPAVTVRLATERDYEGVMNINRDVYGGMDYLPALYHSYIRNPLRVCAVAVMDGQIVSERKSNKLD